jgi:hypothetical protein
MVYFNASSPSAPGTEYHDIKIDDPLLTKYGFTKFSLPLNDNAIKMILYNRASIRINLPHRTF